MLCRMLARALLSAGVILMPAFASADLVGAGAVQFETDRLAEGQAALRSRQLERAERAFSEALRANAGSTDALIGLAQTAQLQGRPDKARDWMAKAVAAAPGSPPILQAQSKLLVEQGMGALAEEHYRRAIAANPGNPQFSQDLASLYLEQLKRPAAAVTVLRDLLRRQPELASAYLGLGLALAADGKLDEAGRTLDEAVQRDPVNPFAYHAQGLLALKQGRADAALTAFDKALALRPEFVGALLGRGDALLALGKADGALATYRRAASLAPGSAVPIAKRAQALERLKRPDEAEAAYREAIKLEPTHTLVLNNLAFLLASRKQRLDEALGLAQRATTLDPARADHFDTLGVVLLARGDQAGARKAFERAVAVDPAHAGARQHLARVGAPAEAPAAAGPSAPAASPREIPKEAARSSTDDAARALSTRLEAWRQAWESKDAGRYLSFYGKDFAPPDGRDRGTWEAERRVRLDKKGEIHVQIVAPELRVEGDTAAVSFEQRYRAGALVDTGRKRMAWHREGGEWMIRREGMQ